MAPTSGLAIRLFVTTLKLLFDEVDGVTSDAEAERVAPEPMVEVISFIGPPGVSAGVRGVGGSIVFFDRCGGGGGGGRVGVVLRVAGGRVGTKIAAAAKSFLGNSTTPEFNR